MVYKMSISTSTAQQRIDLRNQLYTSGGMVHPFAQNSAPLNEEQTSEVDAQLGLTLSALSAAMGNPIDSTLRADLADPFNPLHGATMLGRGVVAIDGVDALLDQPRRTDLLYWPVSYYAGGTTGGRTWRWNPSSTEADDYGSIRAVPGVPVGRFECIRSNRAISAYEYGVRASNTGTENRLRLRALFKRLQGSANTVSLIDENFIVDASAPIIVPADTTVKWGKGKLNPVFESPLPAASTAANVDGTFKCYGGIFATGDAVTGNRYSETNFVIMGRITWIEVKIGNANGLTTTNLNFLHGIVAHGGINVYVDCEIDDMPNNGIATAMFREAHYIRTKCRRCGLAGGGFARNGISNTSTYSYPAFTFPVDDRTTKLTVLNGEYSANYEEGIQFANVPFVWIEGPDCRNNLDRAIEGDTAYAQGSQTRPNDQIRIIGADCRGVPGSTNYSISLNDGFNKDAYIDECRFGGGRLTEVSANCSAVGSFTFGSRNKFDLTSTGLLGGCHAIYVNAGLIDLMAGFVIRGNHDRSSFGAVMISANNDIGGGDVLIGPVDSDVKFLHAGTAKFATVFKSHEVTCPTARSLYQLTLTGNASLVELVESAGLLNQEAATDQGLVRILGLQTFTLAKLVLRGHTGDVNAATRYPIVTPADAVVGSVLRLFSSGNYWKDYSYPFGERLTSVIGLALKTSANDLPVLA